MFADQIRLILNSRSLAERLAMRIAAIDQLGRRLGIVTG
jgi:hypothetical protein